MTIRECVSETARALGFRQKGNLFFRDKGSVRSLIYLRKSRFGETYFVEVGIWIRGVPPEEFHPTFIAWHMGARLGSVLANWLTLRRALNADSPMPDEERYGTISEGLRVANELFLEQWESLPWLFAKARAPFDPKLPTLRVFREYAAKHDPPAI